MNRRSILKLLSGAPAVPVLLPQLNARVAVGQMKEGGYAIPRPSGEIAPQHAGGIVDLYQLVHKAASVAMNAIDREMINCRIDPQIPEGLALSGDTVVISGKQIRLEEHHVATVRICSRPEEITVGSDAYIAQAVRQLVDAIKKAAGGHAIVMGNQAQPCPGCGAIGTVVSNGRVSTRAIVSYDSFNLTSLLTIDVLFGIVT